LRPGTFSVSYALVSILSAFQWRPAVTAYVFMHHWLLSKPMQQAQI